jgi:squid-like protein
LSEDDIKKYFMRFGSVEGIELPFDRQRNRRREFCFIIFDTEDAAEAAVKEAKQTIGSKECDIKKAQPQPVAQQQKRMQQQNADGYDSSSSGGNRRGGRRNQNDNYQSQGQWNYNGAAAQNYYQGYYGNQYPNAYGYPNQGYDYYSQYGYSYGDYWNYYGYGDGTAVAGDYSQAAISDTTGGTYGTTAQNSSQSSSHSQSHHSSGGSTGGKIVRKSGTSSSNYHPYRSSSGH